MSDLRDALLRAAQAWLDTKPHYEAIIVSPAKYADPVFMAALKESFPNGRLVWRSNCDGCLLCTQRGQATNRAEGRTVDDAPQSQGLAQTTTPSGAGPTTGARNADQPATTGPEASGNTAATAHTRT